MGNTTNKSNKNLLDMSEKIKLGDVKFSRLENYNKGIKSQPNYDWDLLRQSINRHGFKPSLFGYITISNDSYCIDGHHRITLLKEIFDEDYIIEVKKLKYSYNWIFFKNISKDVIKTTSLWLILSFLFGFVLGSLFLIIFNRFRKKRKWVKK